MSDEESGAEEYKNSSSNEVEEGNGDNWPDHYDGIHSAQEYEERARAREERERRELEIGEESAREIERFRKIEQREREEREREKWELGIRDEYTNLYLRFQRALLEHKLALQYYEFRSYYFVFLPVTLIATAITIIGFLISGSTQGDSGDEVAADPVGEFEPLLTGQSKQILSLVVGILGAISALFNAIGKRFNYQSQSDMHRSAVKALEKILLTVEFERDWFYRNARNADIKKDDKKRAERVGAADLKTHQASFKAMLDACCDSPVPEKVVQVFTELDALLHEHKEIDLLEENANVENDTMYFYKKLWNSFSSYRWWPLMSPRDHFFTAHIYMSWRKEFLAITTDTQEINIEIKRARADMKKRVHEVEYQVMRRSE